MSKKNKKIPPKRYYEEMKQYHSLFRYYMDFGENKKEFYFNFHLTLR